MLDAFIIAQDIDLTNKTYLDFYKKTVRFGDHHAKVIEFIRLTINLEYPKVFEVARVMRDAAARIDGARPLRNKDEVWHVGLNKNEAIDFLLQVKDAAWAVSHSDAEKRDATEKAFVEMGLNTMVRREVNTALGRKDFRNKLKHQIFAIFCEGLAIQ